MMLHAPGSVRMVGMCIFHSGKCTDVCWRVCAPPLHPCHCVVRPFQVKSKALKEAGLYNKKGLVVKVSTGCSACSCFGFGFWSIPGCSRSSGAFRKRAGIPTYTMLHLP